jgi:hypothetical protein
MDLKPGERIRDNDPRMESRVLVIRRVEEHRVTAQDSMGRTFGIQRQLIYNDGKQRKSGFVWLGDETGA